VRLFPQGAPLRASHDEGGKFVRQFDRAYRWISRPVSAVAAAFPPLALKAAVLALVSLVLAILDFAGVLTGRHDSKGIFGLIGFVAFAGAAVKIYEVSRKADLAGDADSSNSERRG
jgi:hypothetical protein